MNTSVVAPVTPVLPPPVVVGEIACEPLAARDLAPHARAVAEEPARPVVCVGLEDGGVALALDSADDLSPRWTAWMDCVDAR